MLTLRKNWGGGLREWCCLPLVVLFLISAIPSFAQTSWGFDTLALAKLNPNLVTQELPNGWSLGALETTFGDPLPAMQTVANSGKLYAVRVHLINWTCRRNKNCEKTEPEVRAYVPTLKKLAAKWQQFKRRNPKVRCFISPVLEYDEKNPAVVKSWVAAVKEGAPSCEVVLSPFTGVIVPGTLVERHGNEARGDITSNDGESIFDSNSVQYRTSGRVITFAWWNRLNGRVTGEKTFTPPSKRRNWPTRENFRQAARILLPESLPPRIKPAACKTVRSLKEAELLKTNAEDYANTDPRGDRPLLISKSRATSFDVISPGNKKIGSFKFYGPYEKGYNRHYAGTGSGDSGVSFMKKAGSEWMYLSDRGNCLLVNAVRRKGYYR